MSKRNTIHKLPEYKGYRAYYYYDDDITMMKINFLSAMFTIQLTESLRTWLRGMMQKKSGWNQCSTAWLTITSASKKRWSKNTERR